MLQAKLEVQQRNTFGKQSARDLRRKGGVPAVLYGRAQDTVSIQLNARTFNQFLRTYGENVVINMVIGDAESETVVIKEIQRHPVEKHTLVHADFIRISLDEPVTSAVPVVLEGNPPGVQEGGVLEFPLRHVSLHCLPMRTPTDISIDVGELDIGDSIYISDLSLDEDIEILDEPQRIIATVSQPRVQLEEETPELEEGEEGEGEGEEGEEAAEQPSEPEVISRRRRDDDEDE
ncbi:MAG: 50S ribosomal protein L25 [Candidatus Poribacteria bacterium]|nr:50S ribosomal protein L25 [Candidatus Poribacteria bacterium]